MDVEKYTSTRLALHAVAEHLLTADLHRHTSKIGLRPTPGGFGQPEFWVDGVRRRLRVDGDQLVVLEGDNETWHPLSSLSDASRAANAELGAPSDVFTPETELRADVELGLDPGSSELIATWFALGAEALEALRRANTDRAPAIVQLWPEHFDLATNMAEVNFGTSPGDGHIAEPYLYVGPWSPREGEFWNESFGATRTHSEIDGPSDAFEFFSEGLARATR